eukprot:jgi/Picre1/32147/NNA_007493.t1
MIRSGRGLQRKPLHCNDRSHVTARYQGRFWTSIASRGLRTETTDTDVTETEGQSSANAFLVKSDYSLKGVRI